MIEIDLNIQHSLNSDQKVVRQFSFTGNLDQTGDKSIVFIIKEAK